MENYFSLSQLRSVSQTGVTPHRIAIGNSYKAGCVYDRTIGIYKDINILTPTEGGIP